MIRLNGLVTFLLSFTSVGYLLVLGALVLLTRALPRRCSPFLLFAASILFYLAQAPRALPVLALDILIAFLLGGALAKRRAARGKTPRALLALALILQALPLVLLKYLPTIPGLPLAREISLLLPLGISYFTLSGIAYLSDCATGKLERRGLLDVALYLSFFPKIASGPIERPLDFFRSIERLPDPTVPRPREDGRALRLLLSGYLRKLAVADLLAPAVGAVFDNAGEGVTGLSVALAAFLFAWQLYADFAGYTDLARGSSLLLGVPLCENFRRPYGAASVREFWRRWHISLSGFLRDYIYIPLGGSRVSRPRKYFNLLITFLASGVWHGAGLTYLLWGAYHGLLQIAEDLLAPARRRLARHLRRGEKSRLFAIPAAALTFLLVDFGWILFRAPSLPALGALLGALAHPGSIAGAWGALGLAPGALLLAALALLLSELLHDAPLPLSSRTAPFYAAVTLAALALLIAASASSGGGAFIYMGF